jgi:hypothetical protein
VVILNTVLSAAALARESDCKVLIFPAMLVLGLVLGLVLCLSTKKQVLVLVLGFAG